jgi:hypothetical protein
MDPLGGSMAQPQAPDSPLEKQPLPVRMLNEVVFCPRLFYLEFVEREFDEALAKLAGQ